MTCQRCVDDPQPSDFGTPRRCAFDGDAFTPENWNCATITALMDVAGDRMMEVFGYDESMQIIPNREDGEGWGWIVLNRYKHRGKTSSAVYVGDHWPAEPLTLARAERAIVELFGTPVEVSDEV